MKTPAQMLAETMHRIYLARLTTTSGGNLSMRDTNGDIWITPGSIDKGTLRPEDMNRVTPDGKITGIHNPSTELPFHTQIYAERPDLGAIVHVHPPGLLAWAMTCQIPDLELLPAVRDFCPRVERVDYAIPGSPLLGDWMGRWVREGCDVILMDNHGITLADRTLERAYLRMEALEYCARLGILARQVGTPESGGVTMDLPWTPGAGSFPREREQMMTMLRRCLEQGIFTAAFGNLALRLPDGQVLLTPPTGDRTAITADDLIVAAQASPYSQLFARDSAVNAVILARPLHAMAYAVTGRTYDTRTVPESYVMLRDLVRLPNGVEPDALAAAMNTVHPAALVEQDWAITLGTDLVNAFDRMEVLEVTAEALLTTGVLGPVSEISDEEIEKIKKKCHLEDDG